MISTIARTATIFAAAAALVAGASAPAFASDPTTKNAEAKPAKPAKERRYCVEQTSTGTLFNNKVCKTRDQWIAETGRDPTRK